MAKKAQKNISIRKLEDVIKDDLNQVSKVEWHGIVIDVKRNIGIKEVLAIVDSVSKACFQIADDYLPEVKDFVFRTLLVQCYTNLTLPANAEKRYEFLFHTDLIQELIAHIDVNQLDSIVRAINDKVEYMCNSRINIANKQMIDAARSVDELMKQFSSVFDGVSQEDIANISNAMASGKFDEQKLMQAYLDQMYSDK